LACSQPPPRVAIWVLPPDFFKILPHVFSAFWFSTGLPSLLDQKKFKKNIFFARKNSFFSSAKGTVLLPPEARFCERGKNVLPIQFFRPVFLTDFFREKKVQ
jgi:hypothetical protein